MVEAIVTLPGQVPEKTLAWEAIRWAGKYLRHPNGPKAGERFEFVESQIRFLLHWYALDEHGGWVYRLGARRLAKGSGKSPFAAIMALIEFCAPVRFDRWDPEALGGVRGKAVAMPLVQIAATAESQTANTMRMVAAMTAKGSRVVADYSLDAGKTVIYKPGGGTLQIITSSPRTQEGAQPTFVIADEVEHWLPSNGGDQLSEVLDRNLAKSGARMLETCNAWQPGENSIAERTWDAYVAQEEGRTKGKTRILYDARYPKAVDLADDASLSAGLAAAYGDCFWVDQEVIKERVLDPRTPPDVSMRFYLNVPTAAQDSWVAPIEWSALADTSVVVEDGEDVVLFFDGSKSRDATALMGCRMSDGHVFTIGVWEPDTAHDTDSVVPVAAVDATVAQAFERWRVVAFFADVAEWEGFVKVTWPERYAAGLLVWATPAARDPQSIAWDMRSKTYDFTMACELTHTEILEGKFSHDGDSRVARHVANARRRPNRWGTSIGKEAPSSSRKVDGAVCVIGARMARRIVLASKEWQRYERRKNAASKGRVVVLS